MHIELTDHLRCPEPHDEAFLVLLPGRMDGRRVMAGELGCPICQWSTTWDDGVPDFGGGVVAAGDPPCDASALVAMLGIEGAGGWLALAGTMAGLAAEVGALLPGVGVVAINPPEGLRPEGGVQLLRSGRWPLKRHALRGVALGGGEMPWVEQAIGSVLPGLRAVGSGPRPAEEPSRELLAESDALWVLRCR
ncbi:MAG: hypothetical protein IPG05_02945 [Gemmatimonadetes bacterium]|nr:hypothetical protein [Gemmatimonadota bacterium]